MDQRFAWLGEESHQKIMHLLAQEGGEGRFVGSAVRDSLILRRPKDFDIATTHTPERVIALCQAHGIPVHATGFSHGTVTAVIQGEPYQITTLRRDVATDGRHAEVTFTKVWEEDAARRDFTMNALYLDSSGKLYDYFDGLTDLTYGIVRFIGDARARVQEDVLRILRFFRFHAMYGKKAWDQEGLAACRAFKKRVKGLARERITSEVLRLMEAEDVYPTMLLWHEEGFFPDFLGCEAGGLESFRVLSTLEKTYKEQAPVLLRLWFVLSGKKPGLVFSNAEKRQWDALDKKIGIDILSNRIKQALLPLLSSYSKEELVNVLWKACVQTVHAQGASLKVAATRLGECLTWLSTTPIPKFPIQGKDLSAWGVPAGPAMGDLLKRVKTWWLEEQCIPDKKACMTRAQKFFEDT